MNLQLSVASLILFFSFFDAELTQFLLTQKLGYSLSYKINITMQFLF